MHLCAMILAAGRGERMRPLTDHTPKPLLQAGGKALIVWQIEKLVAAGFSRIVINHAHLGSQIEAALGRGEQFGASIHYSAETPPALETAGGIAKALPLLGDQPFAVVNGDVYCEFDYRGLAERIQQLDAHDLGHLVLVDNPAHNPAGDFGLQQQRVASNEPRYTFSGLGVYRPALFAEVPPEQPAKLAPLLRQAIARQQLSGEYTATYWLDVGTPERLQQLDHYLKERH